MMVPTFITSFFGMNVDLPFVKYGPLSVWIITAICLISIFITNVILGLYETKYPRRPKEQKKSLAQKRKERKAARRLKSIEAALEE